MSEEKATRMPGRSWLRGCFSTSGVNRRERGRAAETSHSLPSFYLQVRSSKAQASSSSAQKLGKVCGVRETKSFLSLLVLQWTWLIGTHSWHGQQRHCVDCKKSPHVVLTGHLRNAFMLWCCNAWLAVDSGDAALDPHISTARPYPLGHLASPWGFHCCSLFLFFIWDSVWTDAVEEGCA